MSSRGLSLGIALAALLIPSSAALPAAVATNGIIVGDTTWASGDPVTVSGLLIVASSATLTIEAGTRVFFEPGATLLVHGGVTAGGSSTQRILLTASADTAGGEPAAGAWGGIRLESGSTGLLRHCDLRYATNCVSVYKSSPTLEGCVMEDFSAAACSIDGYDASPMITPRVENCIIRQTDPALIGIGRGIFMQRQADVAITGCWIRNCRDGVVAGGDGSLAPHFTITNTDISDNARFGIYTYTGG